MTEAQPGPLQNYEVEVAGDTVRRTDRTEADEQPEYTGDMPDDPEQAVHHRPDPQDPAEPSYRPDPHSEEAGESEYGNDSGFSVEATREPDSR